MNIQPALDLIRQFEGCRLSSYQDIGGIWTIGYGSTGPSVVEGLIITQAQAEDLLIARVTYLYGRIKEKTAEFYDLTNNEICALCSFTYNVGIGNFLSSTLYKRIQNGDQSWQIADELPRWNKVKDEVVAGLSRRREAEKELFLKKENA